MMVSILMHTRRFSDRTEFLKQLIREEWERRGGDEALLKFKERALASKVLALNDAAAKITPPPSAVSSPANYRKTSARDSARKKGQFPKG